MKVLGYIFLGVIIFFIGLAFGSQPTELEKQQKTAFQDIAVVSDKYAQLFSLCESKYQFALKGDMVSAYSFYGQIDLLKNQINQILTKYQARPL